MASIPTGRAVALSGGYGGWVRSSPHAQNNRADDEPEEDSRPERRSNVLPLTLVLNHFGRL